MEYTPKFLDWDLSPYTGMTKASFMDAAKFMLHGIFQHIKDFQDPVVVPRQETKITYPHESSSPEFRAAEEKAEIFEGLTRSLFIAAPVIANEPEVVVAGYKLADYYKNQILRACTPGDRFFVGTYQELKESTNSDQFRPFQQTVETCALVICLWASKDQIWETYTKEEKDLIAHFLSGFAHAATVPQNWRLFNMLDLAFLHMNGYEIDEDIMLDHAQAIMDFYVGDGWYRDGQNFDYYSCWAFQFYAPLWNVWYGYENMPKVAQKFEAYSNELMKTYGDFFDEDGFTNMWGRSCIYRFAATSSFDGNFLMKHPTMDPGRARRITAGSLLQFLNRDDFLWNGLPTMGFYKQFSPLVQGYSCAESPFWMGKAFLCLHLPDEHPFWTAKENNGDWEKMESTDVKKTTLNGPALCFSNHKGNRSTLLRTGKIFKNTGDRHGVWNYGKLVYNSKFPWESTPVNEKLEKDSVESQQYVLKDETSGKILLPNVTLWSGEREDILYRRQFFDYSLKDEFHWTQGIYLADFTTPYGILRVDKMKLHRRPVMFTLGSFGFPDQNTEIFQVRNDGASKEKLVKEKAELADAVYDENGYLCTATLEKTEGACAIVLKGYDSQKQPKQMAMTIYDGWEKLHLVRSKDTNPDSEYSLIIYAETHKEKMYGGKESYVMISQVITKESADDFTNDDLFPIQKITYEDADLCGTYGKVEILLKNGILRKVDYEALEGNLSL